MVVWVYVLVKSDHTFNSFVKVKDRIYSLLAKMC